MPAVTNVLPGPLLDLLSNDLILRHTSPYIGLKSLVSLAATSKAYKSLVYDTPQVFQHVDMQGVNILMGFNVRNFSMGSRKINELYAQRFRMIFTILENRNVIQDVRTLILDGLFVPITIIEDILCNQRYQIRLLSLRDVNISPKDDVLRIIRHLIRPTRPSEKPELRGLYLFGHPSGCQELHHFEEVIQRPEPISITASVGAQLGAGSYVDYANNFRKLLGRDPYSDSPYSAPGTSDVLGAKWVTSEWSELLQACVGLIAFDAVLCRHNRENVRDPRPRLATVRLTGCKSCGTCPEGSAYPGASPADHLPLLSPPPLHTSKVEVAQRIDTNGQSYPPLIVRCRTCLKDRWCERCNAWWCESCYTIPKNRGLTKGNSASTVLSPISKEDIKVHNGLCVSKCLMDELLNGRGEGGMWG
ncbi:MAG: hypothetical protein ALECFALPRED_008128 [Alectoria fallacina]|uniref:Uncharacterized protein n=1 Tax=Alectoria fallacina TaxID=1903189 RepID=A0A8H3IBP1_9LECA|nr:MAG: hypothetical protein ALECFALPRED_008128 [Alectoria fallacina]